MARAPRAHSTEEHLNRAVPWHLCELVDRCDQERGQAAIDLFVDNEHGKAFGRRLALGERTSSELVAAERKGATRTITERLDSHVAARLDAAPAPRTALELDRRSHTAYAARLLEADVAG